MESPSREPEQSAESASSTAGERQDPEAPESAHAADGGDRTARKQRSFWKELPLLIGIALVLALLIKTFLVQAFSIPSDSMQDTLQRATGCWWTS